LALFSKNAGVNATGVELAEFPRREPREPAADLLKASRIADAVEDTEMDSEGEGTESAQHARLASRRSFDVSALHHDAASSTLDRNTITY